MAAIKKMYLTWEDVYRLLDIIHEQTKGEIKLVTGVPRGGTILAILYSHRFDIDYFPNVSNHYPQLLVLDDIADSGSTFERITEDTPNPKTAALHYKVSSSFKPDFYGEAIEPDYGWIVYPWEKESSNPIQDYLVERK